MADKQYLAEDLSELYATHRRDTPPEVVEEVLSFVKEKQSGPLRLAVDVGCGAGQSAVSFAPHCEKVCGLDVSEAQVRNAKAYRSRPNVEYRVGRAEELPFPDGSAQLLIVGSALHWFQQDPFMAEARRVLCTNGVLAVFAHKLITPLLEDPAKVKKFEEAFEKFKDSFLPYYHTNICSAVEEYNNVHFPFEKVIRKEIRCTFPGRLRDIMDLVTTFAGVDNFKKADPAGAEASIRELRQRLYEIGESIGITPDTVTTLYIYYFLILCRKE